MHSLEGEGDQRNSHDQQIEQVEGRSEEGAFVEDKPVGNGLQADLNSEHRREEDVEVIQDLKRKIISSALWISSEL